MPFHEPDGPSDTIIRRPWQRRWAIALLLVLTVNAGASTTMTDERDPVPATPISTSSADHSAIVGLATATATESLGKPVSLSIDRLQRVDDWAFLLSELRSPGGGAFDFSDTRLAEQAAAGSASPVYVLLLRRDDAAEAGWSIIASSLGPGDVVWESWDREYGAPSQLFAL